MLSIDFGHMINVKNKLIKKQKEKQSKWIQLLYKYGEYGVTRLKDVTPKDTKKTANSWSYTVDAQSLSLVFKNSHINKGVNIAILLQYDHVTGTGGFVKGINYIEPVIQDIIKKLNAEISR